MLKPTVEPSHLSGASRLLPWGWASRSVTQRSRARTPPRNNRHLSPSLILCWCLWTTSAMANSAFMAADPAWCANSPHRQAGLRGHAPPKLQRRGAMHTEPGCAVDGTVCGAHRQRFGAHPHTGVWACPMGNHIGQSAVGYRLRHRRVRQMASGPDRGPLPDQFRL